MVDLHEAGSLRLDRTLFGLADELTRQRSNAAIKAKLDSNQEASIHADWLDCNATCHAAVKSDIVPVHTDCCT